MKDPPLTQVSLLGGTEVDLIFSTSWMLIKEIPSFFLNPFLYIILMLAWLQYHRQTLFERKLFHRRLTSPWEQWFHTVIHGLWGGMLASLLILGFGILIQPFDLWFIAGLSFLSRSFISNISALPMQEDYMYY